MEAIFSRRGAEVSFEEFSRRIVMTSFLVNALDG
jgi:hypothetical protein